jgi:hypothetical protein
VRHCAASRQVVIRRSKRNRFYSTIIKRSRFRNVVHIKYTAEKDNVQRNVIESSVVTRFQRSIERQAKLHMGKYTSTKQKELLSLFPGTTP